MEQKATYSAGFKEQALSKVLSRGKRTIQSVADELNMNVFTVLIRLSPRPTTGSMLSICITRYWLRVSKTKRNCLFFSESNEIQPNVWS